MIAISVDVMGGDRGPEATIPGLALSRERYPELRFVLCGIESECLPVLARYPKLEAASAFRHCDVAVRMDDKPSKALRYGRRNSSMWRAIEAVKNGETDVCVSAGNTGALMAMARFCLRTMADIERPAMAGIWPTLRGEGIVLDIGATIGADARQLVDFSVMGSAMARALFGIERPSVGLLNIGVEEIKGQEEVKEAGRILKASNLPGMDYRGFVEGDDLGKGTVDVVVTEGFSGNIALKAAEGTARQISEYLRASMNRTLMARIGYALARGAFDRLRDRMNPNKVNGGVFLGVNGVVIKSHGNADASSFAAAVDVAHDMVRNGLISKIENDLSVFHAKMAGQSVSGEKAQGHA